MRGETWQHFAAPVRVVDGHYVAPTAPGSGAEILRASRQAFRFPDGPVWASPAAPPGSPTVAARPQQEETS